MAKKQVIRPAIGAIVAVSMLMTVACSKDSAAPKEQPTEPKKEGITFPLAEKVTIKAFANQSPEAKEYNSMAFFKKMEEETNVHIQWDLAVQSSLVERRNLLLASNELPDIFYGASVLSNDDILRASSQGQIIPLDGMIDKYAPNFKKVLDARPEYKKSITASDGHIYTVPLIYEDTTSLAPDALFINKQWLDELGLAMPTTTDEFFNVLKAFKEKDPNKNGKADELPFGFRYQNAKNPNRIMSASSLSGSFGPIDQKHNKHLAIENGKLSFVPVSAGYKKYAQYMHDLFKAGLIDPESFTQDVAVYNSKVTSQVPVLGAFFIWGMADLFGTKQTPYVPVPPLKGPDGHQEWNKANPRIEIGSFAISSTNKHPEISLAWMDQMITEEKSLEAFWGPFGVNLVRKDGMVDYLPTPAGKTYIDFRHSEAPAVRAVPVLLKELLETVVPNANLAEKAKLYKIYEPYLTKEIFPSMMMTTKESEALALVEGEIVNYVEDKLAQWIIKGNIDAEWDAYVAQLEKMQLSKYLTIYQGAYDRYSGK